MLKQGTNSVRLYQGTNTVRRVYQGTSLVYSSFPAIDGLVSYFKLDSNADNSVNASYNGTASNISWIAGKIGTAASFNGSNSLISSTQPNVTNNFAYSLWVYPGSNITIASEANLGTSGQTGQKYVIGPVNGGNSYEGMGISVGGNGVQIVSHWTGNIPVLLSYSASMPNTWFHIVVNCTNRQPSLYINNVLVRTGLTAYTSAVSGSLTYLGNTYPAYGPYQGYADEVACFNRVLTTSEISELYNGGSGITY